MSARSEVFSRSLKSGRDTRPATNSSCRFASLYARSVAQFLNSDQEVELHHGERRPRRAAIGDHLDRFCRYVRGGIKRRIGLGVAVRA